MDKESVFSSTESEVIKIIGRKKMSIQEITQAFLDDDTVFLADQNYMAGIIRRINEKYDKHKLNWFLNGEGLGRGGKTVWREKR